MKRSLLVGCITSLTILSGFTACGNAPTDEICDTTLGKTAEACPDRDSLGFGLEFNTGTLIGTAPLNTIRIKNLGLTNLDVESVTYAGDSAFTFKTEPTMLPASVKGNEYFLIQVAFTPTEAKRYAGTITVKSNASNAPSKDFQLSGCGIPADGGVTPCYGRDAGM